MPLSVPASTQRVGARDHGFHPLRIERVVPETAEASSFVLDVPGDLREAFAYEAGQFCTFRAWIDGEAHLRCYSMSSSPEVDAELQVTVKRVPGGIVSNWMIDTLAPGDTIEVTSPAGVFCLEPGGGDIVAFSAGSGITPVFSIIKTALAATSRRLRLLYANRDRGSTIFADELETLAEGDPDRFGVVHHLDVERGFVDPETLQTFVTAEGDATYYICGPTPFMDLVEQTLASAGVEAGRIHIERFMPAEVPATTEANGGSAGDGTATHVTIELDGRVEATDHQPGTTILQTARQLGMSAPYSCESGSCATCMARVVDGAVTMHVNNALTEDEIAHGWVLTCQAVPTTPTVRVVYGFEDD